jgi:hypothetical protein
MEADRTIPGMGVLALVLMAACGGDDDVVPIDRIPPDKPVSDLSAAERRGVCEWGHDLVGERIGSAGLSCGSVELTISRRCRVGAGCPGTVQEIAACLPNVLDEFVADPCVALSIDSQSELEAFIEAIPGCEGLGECGTVL